MIMSYTFRVKRGFILFSWPDLFIFCVIFVYNNGNGDFMMPDMK